MAGQKFPELRGWEEHGSPSLDFCRAPGTFLFILRGILEWHFTGLSLASFSPATSPAKRTEQGFIKMQWRREAVAESACLSDVLCCVMWHIAVCCSVLQCVAVLHRGVIDLSWRRQAMAVAMGAASKNEFPPPFLAESSDAVSNK